MRGGVSCRYPVVIFRFLPFALAFLRDRWRFGLFGSGRQDTDDRYRRRAERMRDTMLELGPAFVKIGQVLSTRPDIVPPIYADVFGTLQDEVPEDAGEGPTQIVDEEFGDELDRSTLEPIAGGSLAYVYTAQYRGKRIALKVRRPFRYPQEGTDSPQSVREPRRTRRRLCRRCRCAPTRSQETQYTRRNRRLGTRGTRRTVLFRRFHH
jgi:hypothetical protein